MRPYHLSCCLTVRGEACWQSLNPQVPVAIDRVEFSFSVPCAVPIVRAYFMK